MCSLTTPRFRVGTSGWNYAHWNERFYPAGLSQKRWCEHYAGVVDTVEINNTFYRLPEPDIFDRWREQARPGFVYAVKANQFLTHRKRLKDAQGTAKNVIGRRLKQIGARWRVRRVNRMATLCCAVYSDHWNSYRDGICK